MDEEPALVYANYVEVGTTAYEFIFRFGQAVDQFGPPRILVRIVLSPMYAKELVRTLSRSIEWFESNHGPIPEAPVDREEDSGQ